MKLTATAMGLVLAATAATAEDKIVVEFGYPYSHLFDVTYEKILPKFYEQHPNIEIKMRATYESYEDGTNTILREAVAGTLPDVTMQGLNRQAILVEKGIAKSLEPFIAKEADFAKDGYHKAMLDLGTFGDDVYGLPFSISLPVGYYNMEVMAKAGYDETNLPTTWSEVVEACGKLREAGVDNPMFWGWNITGNWFLQALMWSQDKPTVEGNDFQLDTPEGLTALNTMKDIFSGCEMQNLEWKAALASFSAGDLGMMYWSTSAVGAVERAMGDFTLVTSEYPGLDEKGPMGLPAGGNSALMVSTSEDPAELEAAWAWLKFITSGEGAADVARTTGYMPPNQAANEIILKDFYADNPAKATAVRQLPLLREWQAYPGDNGLAATQVIYDGLEGIVTGEYSDMTELQEELTEEVQDLLK
ncbi:sn-glycerol-3-phosphate-binding periplasmic protein UgpB precursor [Tritonibacter multivorans]|uniref:sn-glycerol-3-phosphate-binding periplasmic protein UgpB n=1 Tax=Tritonibacter multivorans TaxID=928856 RepID=A0A0P1GKZ3_9RHOB|nr:extracellular solute-binding protein [Tritonibacter multivorans]MDA7422473.1 extracellular solute-binding protein [Tritonibacter multivorans]CUH74876.1 sn-glycerol-3-phosphate-binding periplasmic protein UgpB precursor [Tritonibacter multivorans]SFD42997.1 carbohydrate ABC transporter substrate-binding protein, CUT1 family [Tritonibacter multivorans]